MNFKEFLLLDAKLEKNAYIDPLTNKKWRMGGRFNRLNHVVKSLLKQGYKLSELWIHFSDLPKFGINPGAADGGTPLGIYGLPVEYALKHKSSTPFLSRPYMFLFKLKSKKNIISIGEAPTPKTILKDIFKKNRNMPLFKKEILDLFERVKSWVEKSVDKLPPTMGSSIKNDILNFYDHWKNKIKEIINLPPNEHSFNKIYLIIKQMLNVIIDLSYQQREYIKNELAREPKQKYSIAFLGGSQWMVAYDYYYWAYYINSLQSKAQNTNDPEKIDIINKRIKRVKDIRNRKYYSIEELPKDFPQQVIESIKLYENLKNWLNEGLQEKLNNKLSRIHKLFLNYEKEFQNNKDKIILPFNEKIRALLKKYNLDFNEIEKSVTSKNLNGQAYLYEFTRTMADKLSYKINKPSYRIWTYLLREIGVDGIIDIKATGSIHPGEPAQGVFFNIKNLEVIELFDNSRNIMQDTLGRPKGEDWSSYSNKHNYKLPIYNKKKIHFAPSRDPFVSAIRDIYSKIGVARTNNSPLNLYYLKPEERNKKIKSMCVFLESSYRALSKLLNGKITANQFNETESYLGGIFHDVMSWNDMMENIPENAVNEYMLIKQLLEKIKELTVQVIDRFKNKPTDVKASENMPYGA